eukprot:s2658_g3.t1
MFRRSLRLTSSVFTACVAGYPVPLRLQSHLSGGWKGVAALSKFPTRALPVDLPDAVRFSSRAVVSVTFLHDMWITLGTIYGESAGQWHPNQLQNNDLLVREVATQVCLHSTGLRVVAGDFNNSEFDLPAFQILRDAGFKDLQSLASDRWGLDVQNTCKCATRVDYCFVSPELQALLTKVHVDQTVWPDHAVLAGFFHGGIRDIPRFVWRQPQPLQWPEYAVDTISDIAEGHATAAYTQIWQEAESAAVLVSKIPIRKACLGRAVTLAPRKLFGRAHAPIKPAREGDVQPQFFGTSVQHAHWYRQVRRLQAYCRFVHSLRPPKDPAHGAQVWGSIVRAKGFTPTFPAWWTHVMHRAPGAPDVFPLVPPSGVVAQSIYDTCVLALRHLERKLKANSRSYAIARRQADPSLIFRDIRQISPDSVDMLIRPTTARVVDVDHDTGCLHLDVSTPWDSSQPVYIKGHALHILHSEDAWIWVDDSSVAERGSKITQTCLTGDLEELFCLFQQDWSARWLRHQNVPPSQWQDTPICFVSVAASPLYPCKIASLAKRPEPASPADFRPITVFGLGYRLWTSIQCKSLLTELDPILPTGLFGNRRGCHPAQLWTFLLWRVEESQAIGHPASGVMADIVKAFNHLPRPVVEETLRLLGVPAQTLVAWMGAVRDMAPFSD